MAIGSITPFRPTGTVSLGAGTLSAAVALAGGGDLVVVTNPSASLAYVSFGADQSATASSPHISHCVGASGPRIGESSFARRTFAEAEEFPNADRV